MVLAVAALVPSRAGAFEVARTGEGAELHLERLPLEYEVVFTLDDDAGEAFSSACRRAFDTWTHGAGGGLPSRYLGPSSGVIEGDGRITLERLAAWDDALGDADLTVAHTALLYDARTGVIEDAAIQLNAARFDLAAGEPGRFDTESVVLHEIGHVLGFAHTCGDPRTTYPSCFSVPDEPPGNQALILEAVMAPTLSTGTRRRDLGGDDLAAVSARYASSATVSAVRIGEVQRTCPEDTLSLEIEAGSEVDVELRRANGRVDAVASQRSGPALVLVDLQTLIGEGAADLVVRARGDPGYAALVPLDVPPACSPPDGGVGAEDPGGCGCAVSPNGGARQAEPSRATIALLVTLLLLLARRRSALALSIAVSLWWAPEALAFKCSRTMTNSGPSLTWMQRVIPWQAEAKVFTVVGDAAVGEAEVRLAFQQWEDLDCSDIELPFAGLASSAEAGFNAMGDNENLVVLVESGWPYDNAAIAVTTSAFDTRSGRVVDSDIEVNGQEFRFTKVDQTCEPQSGTMDLRNTLTHEVGHLLGLDHPPNTPAYQETTMFASAPPCETKKQSLAEDDMDGICSIYPVGQPTQQCVPPDGPSFAVTEQDDDLGGCRDARAGGPISALGVFFFLGLGAALFVRRRAGDRAA